MPRFTVVGPIERMGDKQFNVLVRNVEAMRAFWQEIGIDTKIDWAGDAPPKCTISIVDFVDRCREAGEGAEVEYDIEVVKWADGTKRIRGVDLCIIQPAR